MAKRAFWNAALMAALGLCAAGQDLAAQAVGQRLVLDSGLKAAGAPGVLSAVSPGAAAALRAPALCPLQLSLSLTAGFPSAAPLAPEQPGGLLGQGHAAVLFAAVPDLSRLDNAAAKDTAEADFFRRLGSALAEPAAAAAPAAEAELQKAAILSLRTTQMAAGMKEVEHKTEKLQALKKDPRELKHYLKSNPVPVVVGPKGRLYIIDHHHLVRAAWEADVPEVYIEVKADLSGLSKSGFWRRMKREAWVYPYDEQGRPRDVADLPKDVRGLADDPYRSVAWAVRERGGFEKTGKPFAEFRWADFFRARLQADPRHHDFEEAVDEAMALARSPQAKGLPGYIGRP